MPSSKVFHEAHAFALHRVREDHGRFAGDRDILRGLQRLHHLLEIVTVNFDDLPAKAAVAFLKRLDVHDVFYPAIDLETIAIDDADQVIEFEMGGFHHGFPDAAFLLLPIAHNAKHSVLFVIEFASERHAHSDAEPLSERTTRDFDARQFQPMRMSLEWRVQFAQRHHIFDWEVSCEGKA